MSTAPRSDEEPQTGPNIMALQLQSFRNLEYDGLFAAVDAFRTLLPHGEKNASIHSGEEGQFLELLLTEFLREKLPTCCSVGGGFIVNSRNGLVSYQTDIIVYDAHYHAPILKYGDAVVVDHRSVFGAISVKRTLSYENTRREVEQLANIGNMCGDSLKNRYPVYLALVGFSHASPAPLKERVRQTHAILQEIYTEAHAPQWSLNQIVNDILVVRDFVLHRGGIQDRQQAPEQASYAWTGGEGTQRYYYLHVLLKGICDVVASTAEVEDPLLLDGRGMSMERLDGIPVCAGNRPPMNLPWH